MTWNDHDHRGEYAPDSHYHYAGDLHDVAEKYHDHAGTYSHVSHDHDRSELWSYITDLQNTVDDLSKRVATLAALAAHEAAKS